MNDLHAFLRYVYWKLDLAIPCDQHLEFFQFLQDQPETATILLHMLPKLVCDFQNFSRSGSWMGNHGNTAAQERKQNRDILALKRAIDAANKRIEKEKKEKEKKEQQQQMEREWTRLLTQIEIERNCKSQQKSVKKQSESGSTITSKRNQSKKSKKPCQKFFDPSGYNECDQSKCQKWHGQYMEQN